MLRRGTIRSGSLAGVKSLLEFLIGAAVAIAAVAFLVSRSAKLKTALTESVRDLLKSMGLIHEPPPPPAPEPEILLVPEPEPEPEPVIEVPPPDFGNIRPIVGEERDPDEFGPEIHEFPETREAVTRFEDFNRRLFIASIATRDSQPDWAKTTTDDFATMLKGFTVTRLTEEIRTRLRPRYPVVFDTYGYWAAASRALEMNPDYEDEIVQAYLAIREEERPVVVSISSVNKDGAFTFLRYGFEDFSIRVGTMQPHVNTALTFILDRLRGSRTEWLWFSVARLRQHVVRVAQEDEQKRLALQAVAYLENQAEQARSEAEHDNRFVKLMRHKINQAAETAQLPDATPTPEPANAGAPS